MGIRKMRDITASIRDAPLSVVRRWRKGDFIRELLEKRSGF
jgi:hypothetical protein